MKLSSKDIQDDVETEEKQVSTTLVELRNQSEYQSFMLYPGRERADNKDIYFRTSSVHYLKRNESFVPLRAYYRLVGTSRYLC